MRKLGITLFALLAGGLIYVCWRSETIVMFTWFNSIGIARPIEVLRNTMSSYSHLLPGWFLYSLPNALWLFSGLVIFDVIWGPKITFSKLLWLSIMGIVATGVEVGQALKLFPGTFDYNDISLMLIASLCALLIILASRQKESRVGV